MPNERSSHVGNTETGPEAADGTASNVERVTPTLKHADEAPPSGYEPTRSPQSHANRMAGAPRAANAKRTAAKRSGPKRTLTIAHRDLAPTRGRADAIIVPILGSLLGLMVLGAIGVVLLSRRNSRTRQSALAAFGQRPARWLHEVAEAKRHLASNLAGRVAVLRRRYEI